MPPRPADGPENSPSPAPPDPDPQDRRRLDRRRFIQLSALGAAGVVAGTHAVHTHHRPHSAKTKVVTRPRQLAPEPQPAVETTTLANGVAVPTATWLIQENQRPGTLNWICNHAQPDHTLEGFASQVSAVAGDDVALFVNTTARAVQVQAYRMGYYQGLGGRLVWQSDFVPAGVQPPPAVAPGVGIVTCPWSTTMTIAITKDWPPGCYLLKLVGDGGQQQFVPLTVRDDASTAAYVLQNSVTTWQAYNLYGGYSLYYGVKPGGGRDFANRARAVSFDRPYPQTWASGAADFVGNELPLLFHLESLGLDLTYWTDVDLHARPQLLQRHRCLFSLGHDEYWSQPMRAAAAFAVASGVNMAFLGANACYRQIRLQPTSVGPNRLEVCYKDATEDPMALENPPLTTVNWGEAPVNQPESALIGSMYQSVGARANTVVTDASSWFYDGCNLSDGHVFPNTILGEYDRYVPSYPGPRNVDVLAHSPVPGQFNWSDITFYTAPNGGGGVLATGSASFVSLLSTTGVIPSIVVPGPIPGVSDVIRRAMENLYGRCGFGPASNYGTSSGNWGAVYAGTAGSTAPPAGTPSA